ncbi:MAG: hydrogenase maturation nickel metallochaperone HypA [Anaerolineales bacterium]
MHELPVTQALLDLALEQAKKAHAARVADIYIEVGQLSSYVDDSIQFYWDIISRGTLAEGAELHFQRIPLQMQCKTCESTFQPSEHSFACPDCGSEQVHITAGEELRMVGIDIERREQPEEVIR